MPRPIAGRTRRSQQSEVEQKLVDQYSKDFRRLQQQKSRRRGGVEARVLMNYGLIFGEHYLSQVDGYIVGKTLTDEEKNKLHLVFNMVGRSVWRKIGRLWSINNSFRATPNTLNPVAYDNSEVVSKLILALSKKLREKRVHWNRLFHLLSGGVVIEHVPYIEEIGDESMPEFGPDGELIWLDQMFDDRELSEPEVIGLVQQGATPERFRPKETVQTVGDVGSELFCALNFFIDASVPTISGLAPDQACYLAQIKTCGWIKENFGEDKAAMCGRKRDLNIVKTQFRDAGLVSANLNILDMIPAIQGSWAEGDPEMDIVLTRYSPKSKRFPKGRRCILTPEGVLLDEQDIPYEEIPLVDMHLRPPATSFWTGDFITDQSAGQKFLNKRMSQLGESANANIYEMLLLGEGLTKTDIPTDLSGVIEDGIAENGAPKVQAVQRGTLPGWFVESIRLAAEFLEASGSADLLSQRKFPGQIRGTLALPVLQELLDSEDGPVYDELGEELARVHQMRVNRVKAFYPPVRTLNYVGTNNRNEVLVFHTQSVLRAGYDFSIDIDPASLLPEFSSLREARIRERLEGPLAILYVNPRTNKLDRSMIADDLKYNDKERESKASQARKLARGLINELWQGNELDPALPMPFWDINSIMDELEHAMSNMEWLQASQPVKMNFVAFLERCRQLLASAQESQMQAMESQAVQRSVAMATQQSAAKAASAATDMALDQMRAQVAVGDETNIVSQMKQMLQSAMAGGGSSRLRPEPAGSPRPM